jgi:cytochrome c oxidase assembly factor CtaG
VGWLAPPLPAILMVAVLYTLGARRRRLIVGRPPRHELWRAAAFVASLVLLEAVLCPPVDRVADESLGAHMLQHVVLMSFVPPLLVLAAPWLTIWRGLPLGLRRPLARGVMDLPAAVRRGLRGCIALWPAWLLINADVAVWHVPQLYDAAARNEWIHVLEHVCFVAPALVFWGALLDAPPVRARIDQLHRAIWFTAAMVPSWILAIVLAFATAPVYAVYPSLTDQQLAAGIMWVPGSLTYFVAAIAAFYRWLEPGAEAPDAEPRPEELSWT